MRILVISTAVNDRNGANGSMLDVYFALRDIADTKLAFFARNKFVGVLEGLMRWGIISFHYSRYTHIESWVPDVVFFISSTPISVIEQIRSCYKHCKLIIFQTGDVKNSCPLMAKKIEKIDKIVFQGIGQLNQFKQYYFSYNEKSYLLRPTIKERKFGHLTGTVNTRNFLDKRIDICIAGSVQERKNQLLAVMLVGELKNKFGYDVTLNIVGPIVCPDYKKVLDLYIKESGLFRNVNFAGFRKDYHKYLVKSDIVLSTSKEEGVSTILRESLFLGKLIVATDIVGNVGTLDSGNSILINLNNNAEFNSKIIHENIKNISKVVSLSESARLTYVKYFSEPTFRENISGLITSF